MVEATYFTSVGKVRKTNQDFVKTFKNRNGIIMGVVCDGIGGHQGGDVASNMAVNHLGHNFMMTDFCEAQVAQSWLSVQLKAENDNILRTATKFADLNGMGTTIVLAIIFADQALIAHLGDSRAYLYRDRQLTQLTEDHSLVNELLKMGQITEQEAKNHPQKNIITQTLGVSSTVDPEFSILEVHTLDIFLLCTDGLTNSLTDEQIQTILVPDGHSLKEKCKKLIDEANRLGGGDNITVCLLDCSEKEGQ
ncbi:Stp1/IreP family PP2C-type Ser/Thr phosphatase [Lactobacillus iners]|uniref:Stp1/IreP family PP2C-type Ser/Thr phosphatase n=1 Tax=Lactobacillus iners TaxID=147802 RepID=UPI0029C141D0|nr:Stp1/IreP family PP2C-type Ser/Thr phosphatase [Lactobacillus iners]MDX5070229.1 Stp1/IreP family PP2C-type Ser/Thr phosphatase [Lactobacillus iners]MDX5084089.1 Stp1/IreP family PP2C-type Ser/Thr phosphatase [Lactobacillus iners]MDX5095657.1 Stp1/IreP family PP2C-type Ser/Thr phosphatase [Lactobacillus iners]